MEEEKFSGRYGTIRSFFSRLHPLHPSLRREGNSAYSKSSVLKKSTISYQLSNPAGFTLIEIITAIGVLTILATIALAAVNPIEQFRKAQDAKRKSDLAQVQRALEAYYQDFGRYPAHTIEGLNTYTINTGTGEDEDAIGWGETWSPYIDIIPVDPSSSKFYIYVSDSGNGNQSYRIYASLDRGTNDPDTCADPNGCINAPGECGLEEGMFCNFGLTSPNVSP